MSSGIQAGTTFPVAVKNDDDVEHRRRLADAINELAAAAYTPYTQQIQIEDVDFGESPGADLGLTLSVTPFVPAKAHVILILQMVNADAVVDLNAQVDIQENGVTIATLSNVYAATGGASSTCLVLQILSELEPNTTYTYTVIGIMGAGESGLAGTGSSLSLRLEHRKVTT